MVLQKTTRKNLLIWLIPTLAVAVIVPLIFFITISQCARGTYTDDTKVAFKIGSLSVAWYGIFIFIGFVCAIFMGSFKLWKLYKVPIDPFYWYCLMGIPVSILGARMWSCIIGDASWKYFFDFQNGGLAIEGGVVLTVILGVIYFPLILKRPNYQVRDEFSNPVAVRQVSVWVYADAIVPAILIGQVLGRYGNYMNQEVYGNVITGSWAQFINNLFPYMTGVAGVNTLMEPGSTYQPLFLIESFANFWGLMLIYFVGEFIPKKKAGDLGICYFLWYGILRAILNPFRASDFAFNATSISFSVVWAVVGLALLILNHTVFPKMRKYRCTRLVGEWFRLIFTFNKQRWHNAKNDKEKKTQETLYYFGR